MKAVQILLAAVSVASVQAAKKDPNVCHSNNLIRCFLSSSALAAPYCSSYIGDIEPTTTAVIQQTNIFTQMFTNTIWTVQTDTATDSFTTTTTLPAPIFNPQGKTKPPKPTPTTLKCVKNQKPASISHACSCFESAVGITHTTTQTSTTTTTTPITTFVTSTSTTVTTVEVAVSTAVLPDPGPYCNQRGNFVGTDPTTELNVIEGVDANGCAAACSSQPGCISYVLYDYFGLCGLFNVPVSEIAADTGDYTFWDISCATPPPHTPTCDAPGTISAAAVTVIPIATPAPGAGGEPDQGMADQASCQAQCVNSPGCLSYSLSSGACVIYGAWLSQWEAAPAPGNGPTLIAWDAACLVLSDYCGFMGGGPNYSGTSAPFAEYCYQLCNADSTCVSYTFDPVNLNCEFYSQTVAVIAPVANPNGVAWYDISCPAPTYPDPACGVYASTNTATDANFISDVGGISSLYDCQNNCLYGCASVEFYVDGTGTVHCKQYSANLASMVPPPDLTQTTVWYDAACPVQTP